MSTQNLSLVTTADGSKTIFNSEVGENYHSKHGALQESMHVFLRSGLQYFLAKSGQSNVSVLEIGFGTGLNFLVSADFCARNTINLQYTGIEAYPLDTEMIANMDYDAHISPALYQSLLSNYTECQSQNIQLGKQLMLQIFHGKVLEFTTKQRFDVIYFDAFAAIHQPEMWTKEVLEHCCQYLEQGGVFVTYAITGDLKRIMKSLGFEIEKAPGAPGKREMLRAIKN